MCSCNFVVTMTNIIFFFKTHYPSQVLIMCHCEVSFVSVSNRDVGAVDSN